MWFLVVALLTCLITAGTTDPVFTITSPLKARYSSRVYFTVSAFKVRQRESVHLKLQTKDMSPVIMLSETTIHFENDGVQTWPVEVSTDRLASTASDIRTLELIAEHRLATESLTISLESDSGYILVQTDKVIYTPRQTVKYRIIAVDEDQRIAKWPVTVDIMNQDMIILERQHHSSENAFIGREFALSRDALPGTWTIRAYYSGKVSTTTLATFEVQEYVLPIFKAEVSVEEKVIGMSTNWLKVNTKAVYSYGEPVLGSVELRLGATNGNNIVLFQPSYTGVLNASGECSMTIPIRPMRNSSVWFPNRQRLYVTVNVTEAGTGENATAVDMGTYFADPYYKISFKETKEYFRPGFPYKLVISVSAANGAPAKLVPVYVKVMIRDETGVFLSQGFDRMYTLDDLGRLSDTFDVVATASLLKIKVIVLDPRVPDWSNGELDVKQLSSVNSQYVFLDVIGNDIMIRSTPTNLTTSQITILIFSRGQLVFSTSVSRSRTGEHILQLTPYILREATPRARVLAFFYVEDELAVDSVLIDTEDVCQEELSLSLPEALYLGFQPPPKVPKQEADIQIEGGYNMRVGLVAVDKAVYFLRDERSLTREKLFATLASHDQGNGIGDGRNVDKIFENTGVQYMKLSRLPDVDYLESSLDLPLSVGTILHDLRNNLKSSVPRSEDLIPLDQVRKYFPESWLFIELTLPSDGFAIQNITLPDSITTWSLMAVGVGEQGGVCVSPPLELVVFKPFFAQLRLPYRAVRLEEVIVNVGIYNYRHFAINVTVNVSGDTNGLCFSEGEGGQRHFLYEALLPSRGAHSKSVSVIPLRAGDVPLRVLVQSRNEQERDIVEKTLYVVTEGRRVQKSITFPLDPSGEHSDHQSTDEVENVQSTESATLSNKIFQINMKQLTTINLYMPEEIIHGSEKCQISACGDLMGDIISRAVLKGENLFESSVVDAEEVIGNLAPTVYALLYLNKTQFLTENMKKLGQTHVKLGVARLLNYRSSIDGSFHLTKNSSAATWLTALVLKTLCHAEKITFVDHSRIVEDGFRWLLNQIRGNGTVHEKDRRLAKPSLEYDLMLSAEVLIALRECNRSLEVVFRQITEFLSQSAENRLQNNLKNMLTRHLHQITSPLVMAKTTYALALLSLNNSNTTQAFNRLKEMVRIKDDLHYWSLTEENQPASQPFWYHSGSRASSIEATAYALLVFVRPPGRVENSINIDSIAGWLIQKRNIHGAFIGALDTAAATQALSRYSLAHVLDTVVNLHCNVTTSPIQDYSHSFEFDMENAITPKSLTNVPVGRQLKVETHGTGLGQMQIQVEYNIPVEANAECKYNVTIQRHIASFTPVVTSENEVCRYCNMGCERERSSSSPPRTRRQMTATRLSMCLQVCLRSLNDDYADRTTLEIEMLSGFEPNQKDLTEIMSRREKYSMRHLVYDNEKSKVVVLFDQVAKNVSTCVSFRAIERREVNRRNPATVSVRAYEDQDPTCAYTYDPVKNDINLALHCATNHTNNQGQCRCFSGYCGNCSRPNDQISINDIWDLMCKSTYVYKIQTISREVSGGWVNMNAMLQQVEKAGEYIPGNIIRLSAPIYCPCPVFEFMQQTPHYFFGSHVDIFSDRANEQRATYLLDETTAFLSDDNDRISGRLPIVKQNPCPSYA